MGYNLFNIKEVSNAFNTKLSAFRASLGNAISRGQNITFADNDISYILKLQHDRISRKGLELNYDIYSREAERDKFIAGSNWRDAHYESTVCFSSCGVKRNVKQGGKTMYKDDRKTVLYETITDAIAGAHPGNESISCPNCSSTWAWKRIPQSSSKPLRPMTRQSWAWASSRMSARPLLPAASATCRRMKPATTCPTPLIWKAPF